jgi:hypothetical protein
MLIGYVSGKYTNKRGLELKPEHKLFFNNNWGELGTVEISSPRPYGANEAAIAGVKFDNFTTSRAGTSKNEFFIPKSVYLRILDIIYAGPRLKSK